MVTQDYARKMAFTTTVFVTRTTVEGGMEGESEEMRTYNCLYPANNFGSCADKTYHDWHCPTGTDWTTVESVHCQSLLRHRHPWLNASRMRQQTGNWSEWSCLRHVSRW